MSKQGKRNCLHCCNLVIFLIAELKMKGLPPSIRVPKEDNTPTLMSLPSLDSSNPPPIITHTCATPMATPQVGVCVYVCVCVCVFMYVCACICV